MTRRKSACINRTLVIVLVFLCQNVISRPQDDTASPILGSTLLSSSNKPTVNPIRYNFKYNFNLSSSVVPIVLSPNSFQLRNNNALHHKDIIYHKMTNNIIDFTNNVNTVPPLIQTNNLSHRTSRLIKNYQNKFEYNNAKKADNKGKTYSSVSKSDQKGQSNNYFTDKNKPVIKKVITKWTDKTKYEDLRFNIENNNSKDEERHDYSKDVNDYSSGEDIGSETSELSKDDHPKLTKKVYYKPRPQYPTNPPNIQYIDNYSYTPTRPAYVFSTPTPTPIITNVGYPPPWPQPNFQVIRPAITTKKPVRATNPVKDHYNFHNNVNNYPQYPVNNFEVTTIQPTSTYTDRIVIRPEEYNASPDGCPTIFLTLNNTFQGQAKEACPDLNIAVNTNVVNKNVVVESGEDNEDSFVDALGVPLMDDSESGDSNNDYNESSDDEEENESASIEGTALTNYNANTASQESAEPGTFASPSSALSTVSRPQQPTDNDDDLFSFSSIIDFFKPALSAFNWLAAINPLSFGIISFILAPVAIILAATSGFAALFAPFALTYARAAPQLHLQHPQWFMDSNHELLRESSHYYDWNSLPHKIGKINDGKPSIKPTMFYRLKEWMRSLTQKLRNNQRTSGSNNRKYRRRKRDIWNSTVK